jgi:hypothetical protein
MPANGQNPSDVRFRQSESPDDKNCQAAPPNPPSAWPAWRPAQFARASLGASSVSA